MGATANAPHDQSKALESVPQAKKYPPESKDLEALTRNDLRRFALNAALKRIDSIAPR